MRSVAPGRQIRGESVTRSAGVAGADLLPAGSRTGERWGRRLMEGGEEEGQVAVPYLSGPLIVAKLDRLQLLEQEGEIADLNIRAECPGGFHAVEEMLGAFVCALALAMQFLDGGKGAGKAEGQGTGPGIQAAGHEPGEGSPGVAIVGQGDLHLSDVAAQAVETEVLEEILLAPVAAVEGGDPYPGARGHGGDRGLWIGKEDGARGLQDPLVVAGGLGTPPVQRYALGDAGWRFIHVTKYTLNGVFRSAIIRTEQSVLLLSGEIGKGVRA